MQCLSEDGREKKTLNTIAQHTPQGVPKKAFWIKYRKPNFSHF